MVRRSARGTPPHAEGSAAETLLGVLEGVTYHDPGTLYTVLRLTADTVAAAEGELASKRPSSRERVVYAVGRADELPAGARIALRGRWESHPKHGPRFHFATLQVLPPKGREGVVRYLASRNFRGIGPVLAARIVTELGPEALELIDADPACLRRVRGLSKAARESLVSALRAQRGERELQSFLYGLELNAAQVLEASRALGADGEARVRSDPYLLARHVSGIGFASADRAAQKLGLPEDSPERRRAALLFALELGASEGHTCLAQAALRERAGALIERELDAGLVAQDLELLRSAQQVTLERIGTSRSTDGNPAEGSTAGGSTAGGSTDELRAYLPALATSEAGLAANLAALARVPARPLAGEAALVAAERGARLALHPDQRRAVLGCLSSPVVLLTGGPGVGKTTIVRLVAELAERAGTTVALASPTGRAAKRLSEATGRPASTIHRLLGWDPRAHRFEHDSSNPLAAGLLIVDEISMLDVILAHHLLKAVQPPARLVLVGDPDQLPSVSAGNVLSDLLASGVVPVFRLSRVYRQEATGLIVENAHRILQGEMPRLLGRDDPPGDFYFFPAESDEQAAARAIEVVTQRIPERFGLEWIEDVQVLSPMYRGACGVDELNERLGDALAPSGGEIVWRARRWRVGDRVIQTRNDYEKQVFNGDMGRIARLDAGRPGLVVRFPERNVAYAAEELTDLSPAFAITVHRAQGGEFPAVVIPLVMRHFPMLQRNLLYTAVTRARRLVVLVGQTNALQRALANAEQGARESGLAERLRRLAEGL